MANCKYIILNLWPPPSGRTWPWQRGCLLLLCMGGFTCLCVHTHGPCLLPGEWRACLLAGLQDCKQMDCRCMARLGSLTEACRGASDGTQMMIGSISTDARTKGGYGYRTMWLGSKTATSDCIGPSVKQGRSNTLACCPS